MYVHVRDSVAFVTKYIHVYASYLCSSEEDFTLEAILGVSPIVLVYAFNRCDVSEYI